jgi:hypothetical protein
MKMNLVYGQIYQPRSKIHNCPASDRNGLIHRNLLMQKIKQKIRAYLRTNFKIFKRELDERLEQNLPINELTAPYHGVQSINHLQ